jgi:hypothetical protein
LVHIHEQYFLAHLGQNPNALRNKSPLRKEEELRGCRR